jgi:hypothetical protein
MITNTGFRQDVVGSWIPKDPDAELVYSIDWASEWLPQGASIVSAVHTVTPVSATTPLTISSQGVQSGGVTYVELAGGVTKEIYTIECTVTLDNGATDSRRFRIKVEDRFL